MKKLTLLTLMLFAILWYVLYMWSINISIHTVDSYEPGPTILMIGGTHGNEPAGKYALLKFLEKKIKIKRGNLIIIPDANKSGGALHMRWLMHNWLHPDLNRNYTNQGKDEISKKIIDCVNKVDLVIDFHEGWGYRLQNPDSMGTTLSYTTDRSRFLAEYILEKLNDTIYEDHKKFILNEDTDDLLTLRNYANRHNKDYILVETTGQNDIQKIETRVNQSMIIIYHVLLKCGMIDGSEFEEFE